jgi:hypothetical protein
MLVPKVISKFSFLVFLSFVQCKPEASKDEFISMYTKLSDSRINFRTNMKALGDSSYSHQDYAMRAMNEVNRDSTFESGISENYKAYNDSLKKELLIGQDYFHQQWVSNKPLITTWEKADMKYDKLIQGIKNGDISESEALDSIVVLSENLNSYINESDSLLKKSTDKYWSFRKTFEEYKFNMKNLKYLYASKLK